MTNIRCKGGKEIDLLAINPKTLKRYHIEARVTTTGFKILPFDTKVSKGEWKGRAHRIGLDFFRDNKFEHKDVKERIQEIFGCEPYEKILVVWDVKDDSVIHLAETKFGFKISKMRNLLRELLDCGISGSRDDILRLVELLSK